MRSTCPGNILGGPSDLTFQRRTGPSAQPQPISVPFEEKSRRGGSSGTSILRTKALSGSDHIQIVVRVEAATYLSSDENVAPLHGSGKARSVSV